MLSAVGEPDRGERKKCFVAMPITTPTLYEDLRDPDHFGHVLEHLFAPALVRAGYEVIPPKALGATLIHAEIIKHLEQADLVLADLSSHNANVFFELGLRTSLDRPVVLVKDKRTTAIPFDLGTINVLTYEESLTPWTLEEEVKRLAEHVGSVPVDGGSGNAMWRYFGLTKRGGPAEAGSLEEKVNLLLAEVTKLRLAPPIARQGDPIVVTPFTDRERLHWFEERIRTTLGMSAGSGRVEFVPTDGPGEVDVHVWGTSVAGERQRIRNMGEELDILVGDVIGHPLNHPKPLPEDGEPLDPPV
jgi:hypothetical protein